VDQIFVFAYIRVLHQKTRRTREQSIQSGEYNCSHKWNSKTGRNISNDTAPSDTENFYAHNIHKKFSFVKLNILKYNN